MPAKTRKASRSHSPGAADPEVSGVGAERATGETGGRGAGASEAGENQSSHSGDGGATSPEEQGFECAAFLEIWVNHEANQVRVIAPGVDRTDRKEAFHWIQGSAEQAYRTAVSTQVFK